VRERVWISAREGLGLDLLRNALGQRLGLRRVHGEVQLPPEAGRLRARLHALGAVRGETHDEQGWRLSLDLAHADAMRIAAHADGSPLRALLLEAGGSPP
jgi:GTP-binding protein HflX